MTYEEAVAFKSSLNVINEHGIYTLVAPRDRQELSAYMEEFPFLKKKDEEAIRFSPQRDFTVQEIRTKDMVFYTVTDLFRQHKSKRQ